MINNDFDIKELEIKWPKAYAVLPEAYKADSCLVFFIDVNGHLCAQDDFDKQYMFVEYHKFSDPTPFWIEIG